jgi:TonB family protein
MTNNLVGSGRPLRAFDMRRYFLAVIVVFCVCVTLPFAYSRSRESDPNALQGFFIVSHVVSDAAPIWFDYILDVRPKGTGTVIRDIRIAPLNSYCPRSVTVKAVEQVIPSSTVSSVAKFPLCSLPEEKFASAIKAAKPGIASIDDAVRFTIVANCGSQDKVFDLPFPETLDFQLLKKRTPSVAALWTLAQEVTRRAFGRSFSFYGVSSGQDDEFQELGSRIISELKAGKYDSGFVDEPALSSVLNDYVGPVADHDPASVELVGISSAELEKYVPPNYPPLAKQARIEGEVGLRFLVDRDTGDVKMIEVTSGHPLLVNSALTAVRQWKFRPGDQQKEPREVILKFGFRCPAQ